MKDNTFNVKTIQNGKSKPFADKIYDYIIESKSSPKKTEQYCINNLEPKKNTMIKDNTACFDGFSADHGLNTYYKFISIGNNKYQFTVCVPNPEMI